jgi:uncharacterized membrane protein YdfJ with MMPL/SSD domain
MALIDCNFLARGHVVVVVVVAAAAVVVLVAVVAVVVVVVVVVSLFTVTDNATAGGPEQAQNLRFLYHWEISVFVRRRSD